MARQGHSDRKPLEVEKPKKLSVKREPLRDLKTTPAKAGRVRGGGGSSTGGYAGTSR